MKKVFPFLVAGSIAATNISFPAQAQGEDFFYEKGFLGQGRSELRVMTYFKINFSGGLKTKESPIRFGLALNARPGGVTQDFSYSGFNRTYQMDGTVNLLDLSFGPSGSDSFKLNGHSFTEMNAFYAGEDENAEGEEETKNNKKKKKAAKIAGAVVLIGLAATAGVVIALKKGFEKH